MYSLEIKAVEAKIIAVEAEINGVKEKMNAVKEKMNAVEEKIKSCVDPDEKELLRKDVKQLWSEEDQLWEKINEFREEKFILLRLSQEAVLPSSCQLVLEKFATGCGSNLVILSGNGLSLADYISTGKHLKESVDSGMNEIEEGVNSFVAAVRGGGWISVFSFLCGSSGLGKTQLAFALKRRVLYIPLGLGTSQPIYQHFEQIRVAVLNAVKLDMETLRRVLPNKSTGESLFSINNIAEAIDKERGRALHFNTVGVLLRLLELAVAEPSDTAAAVTTTNVFLGANVNEVVEAVSVGDGRQLAKKCNYRNVLIYIDEIPTLSETNTELFFQCLFLRNLIRCICMPCLLSGTESTLMGLQQSYSGSRCEGFEESVWLLTKFPRTLPELPIDHLSDLEKDMLSKTRPLFVNSFIECNPSDIPLLEDEVTSRFMECNPPDIPLPDEVASRFIECNPPDIPLLEDEVATRFMECNPPDIPLPDEVASRFIECNPPDIPLLEDEVATSPAVSQLMMTPESLSQMKEKICHTKSGNGNDISWLFASLLLVFADSLEGRGEVSATTVAVQTINSTSSSSSLAGQPALTTQAVSNRKRKRDSAMDNVTNHSVAIQNHFALLQTPEVVRGDGMVVLYHERGVNERLCTNRNVTFKPRATFRTCKEDPLLYLACLRDGLKHLRGESYARVSSTYVFNQFREQAAANNSHARPNNDGVDLENNAIAACVLASHCYTNFAGTQFFDWLGLVVAELNPHENFAIDTRITGIPAELFAALNGVMVPLLSPINCPWDDELSRAGINCGNTSWYANYAEEKDGLNSKVGSTQNCKMSGRSCEQNSEVLLSEVNFGLAANGVYNKICLACKDHKGDFGGKSLVTAVNQGEDHSICLLIGKDVTNWTSKTVRKFDKNVSVFCMSSARTIERVTEEVPINRWNAGRKVVIAVDSKAFLA